MIHGTMEDITQVSTTHGITEDTGDGTTHGTIIITADGMTHTTTTTITTMEVLHT